jgi:GT2 family glycosyltransferase
MDQETTAAAAIDRESAGQSWWTPRLQEAALRCPTVPPPEPELLAHYPFLAWLAEALRPARREATAAAAALARGLDAAGLAGWGDGRGGDATDALPTVSLATAADLLAGTPSLPRRGVLLVQGVAPSSAAWDALRAAGDHLLLPQSGGLSVAAAGGAAPGAVGALLRAARDPEEAERIAALFAALGERLAREAELLRLRTAAETEALALRRAIEAAEARAAVALSRLQAVEASTAWRAWRLVRHRLERHPALVRHGRRGAHFVWRRILRPLVGPAAVAGVAAPTAPPRPEASIAVPGTGTMVFAAAAGLPEAAAIVAGDRRTEAPAAPARAPSGRGRIAAFFPGGAVPPLDAALELRMPDGGVVQRPMPPVEAAEPMAAIRGILARVGDRPEEAPALLRDHAAPAVEACWAAHRRAPVEAVEETFGTPPAAPEVSVVVPLHGRVDFLLHQATHFSNDPDLLARAELIYVLDDPPRREEAERLARIAHSVYGVPIRLLRLSRNCGYSGANNAGARAARGEALLLLNSDVLPLRPGWIDGLLAAARELPECGALGCRLLFEDGTLQHAGMAFVPFPALAAWRCDHPFKGEPVGWDEPSEPREVPAVTGACLLVRRAVYEAVGGLSEGYVVGDFEDADLCHRIAARGLRIWYDPRVELLHLERQSMALLGEPGWRYALTLCNMLRHARLWRDRLQALAPLPATAPPEA